MLLLSNRHFVSFCLRYIFSKTRWLHVCAIQPPQQTTKKANKCNLSFIFFPTCCPLPGKKDRTHTRRTSGRVGVWRRTLGWKSACWTIAACAWRSMRTGATPSSLLGREKLVATGVQPIKNTVFACFFNFIFLLLKNKFFWYDKGFQFSFWVLYRLNLYW